MNKKPNKYKLHPKTRIDQPGQLFKDHAGTTDYHVDDNGQWRKIKDGRKHNKADKKRAKQSV